MTETTLPTRDRLILAALLVLAAWFGLRVDRAPEPVPADAGLEEFSAARARVHLREITRAPHAVGSVAHGEVRDYLMSALAGLGIDAEVQRTTTISPRNANYGAYVQNIVARVPGTDSTGAVALVAHYDSVPHSYGASDAGAGVAAILETLRALQNDEHLRNDIIVLITDAEEVGLLGARAFVDEHPWAEDIAILLNVEARGASGAAYMFQTTGPNGFLIDTLAEAAPSPVATTLMQEVYERLPNGTDLTEFMGLDLAGMDFAFIRQLSHYHTPLDNFENQSAASLQHHGEYLLSLARAFGQADLTADPGPEQTYFNLGSLAFVHYPMSWTLPLAVVVALLAVVGTIRAIRAGHARVGGVLAGGVLAVFAVGAAVLIGVLGWRILQATTISPLWDSYRLYYDSTPYLLAVCVFALAIVVALVGFGSGRLRPAEAVVAPMLCWAAAGVLAAIYAPGTAYLFVWPALAVAASLGTLATASGSRRGLALGLAAAPALLLVFPWVVWLEVAMTLSLAPALTGLLGWVAILLAAQLEALVSGRVRLAVAALLLVGAGAVVWGAVTPEYDEERPRRNSLTYAVDLDAGDAFWVSTDPELDEWTAQTIPDATTRMELPRLGYRGELFATPAEVGNAMGPSVEVFGDTVRDESRNLQLHITLPAGTFRTTVEVLDGASIISARLDERWELPVRDDEGEPRTTLLRLMGPPSEGFALDLSVQPGVAPQILVRGIRPGLPAGVPPRPADTMDGGDWQIVQQTFTFPEANE